MPKIDPTAIIDYGAEIGRDTRIYHFCHVCEGAKIGCDCVLGQNVYVGPGVSIGDYCRIQNNVSVYEGVTMADHVFVGPSVVFTNVREPRPCHRATAYEETHIERGVVIGANATILCGLTIHENAFIGAGATVLKDVPQGAKVMEVWNGHRE